jgi:hypothetical protein
MRKWVKILEEYKKKRNSILIKLKNYILFKIEKKIIFVYNRKK